MIGNAENNVAALYNIGYDRPSRTSKFSTTTCQVFEHELFYSSYGIERFSLQSEIGKPVLRVKCNYQHSHVCLQPLLHTVTDMSSFSLVPDDTLYGNKHKTTSKINLRDPNNLGYLLTCDGKRDPSVSSGK